MDQVSTSVRANEEQFAQFERGLTAVLGQWTALLLAAQHCDPGAPAALRAMLLEWFQSSGEVFSDELQDYFEDFFESARGVVVEDDSVKEVSDILHDMYYRCAFNDFAAVEHYLQSEALFRQQNALAHCVNGTADNDADDFLPTGDGAYVDPAQLAAPEEDGVGGENEEGGAGEELYDDDAQLMTAQEQPQKKKRKKKNAYVKSSDGWNVVL